MKAVNKLSIMKSLKLALSNSNGKEDLQKAIEKILEEGKKLDQLEAGVKATLAGAGITLISTGVAFLVNNNPYGVVLLGVGLGVVVFREVLKKVF